MKPEKTALILGVNGRFGRAARHAFARSGWQILAHTRPGATIDPDPFVEHTPFDLLDQSAFGEVAAHADVIINAINPPYPEWTEKLPPITRSVIRAAKSSGATVMLPGNVYNFGAEMPPILSTDTPQIAKTQKGKLRIEMEKSYKTAQRDGVQTIILRVGDFFERRNTGDWFAGHITKSLSKGKLTYPGRTDIAHAWGYLPDAARAMADLADIRENLPLFTDIPFEGTTMSGEQLVQHIARALDRPIHLSSFPWWMVRAVSPFSALLREVLEMRYLWDIPHQLDPEPLSEWLPDFRHTPIESIMSDILADQLKETGKSEANILPHHQREIIR